MPLENTSANQSYNIKALKKRLSSLETEEGRIKGLSFKPRETDIIIATSTKSGTTWIQQIVQQLRTGGDEDYDDICERIPYLEMAHDCGLDPNAEQPHFPRAFKTHAWYRDCPKGAKYIVCVREPCSVAYSFYRFFEGYFFQPGEVGVEEFVLEFWLERDKPVDMMQNASYFHHLVSWWEHRSDPNVLYLSFEDLKEDREGCVRKIAKFIGVFNEQAIDIAIYRSSFEYMKANGSKFNENLLRRCRNEFCGILPSAVGQKIREGSNEKCNDALTDNLKARIQEKWKEIVTPVTNCETYSQFRQQCKSEK
jgi:hypothetical protein